MALHEFSGLTVFLWKLAFYHWHKILPVVFLEVTGSLLSFLRKCLLSTQGWTIAVCLPVILSSKNSVLLKKKKKKVSSALNSNNCKNAFPQDTIVLCYATEMPCLYSIVWQNTQVLRFSKMEQFLLFHQGHS